jgi:hypothetical protein
MSNPAGGLQLPNELNLPPHLSAHKYFLVCTLTVAAWDTLVVSPRALRLWKMPGWPALKLLFHFLQVWMPAEFIVVAVGFFDTKWSIESCEKFYLFEPICTAVLLAAASAVHVIRITAIYDRQRTVVGAMAGLFALQVIVTGVMCGFYFSVPLLQGQGCIAGPKHTWVGLYWIAPTLLYIASFGLALSRSLSSLAVRPLSLWKLMLRDGLNLYGAIVLAHLANVFFWFLIKPTGRDDPIRTIVTSMTAVLTASMSLRIVLSVRGTLVRGGAFALSATTSNSGMGGSSGGTGSRATTHVISAGVGRRSGVGAQMSIGANGQTYTLDDLRTTGTAKVTGEWGVVNDAKSSVHDDDASEGKVDALGNGYPNSQLPPSAPNGIKVTIDREIDYDSQEARYRK